MARPQIHRELRCSLSRNIIVCGLAQRPLSIHREFIDLPQCDSVPNSLSTLLFAGLLLKSDEDSDGKQAGKPGHNQHPIFEHPI